MSEADLLAKYGAGQDGCSGCSMRGFCRDGKPILVPSDPENHWQPSLEKYRHHPGEAVVPSSAELFEKAKEELKRATEILGNRKEEPSLTVGDLSYVTKRKREGKNAAAEIANRQRGLTVGDLYQGPAVRQPTTSPSQDIAASIIQKHRKKMDEERRIRDLTLNL